MQLLSYKTRETVLLALYGLILPFLFYDSWAWLINLDLKNHLNRRVSFNSNKILFLVYVLNMERVFFPFFFIFPPNHLGDLSAQVPLMYFDKKSKLL